MNCGFKPKYIIATSRNVVSNTLASGCVYNADISETQYRNINNQTNTMYDIGSTEQSRGLNIGQINNDSFTIWGAHNNSPIYVLAVG